MTPNNDASPTVVKQRKRGVILRTCRGKDCGKQLTMEDISISGNKFRCYRCMRALANEWRRNAHADAKPLPLRAYNLARNRADVMQVPFDLRLGFVKILFASATTCPVIPGARVERLMLVKPALGYVEGNVIAVSVLADRIRPNDATTDQIRAVANLIDRLEVGEFYD